MSEAGSRTALVTGATSGLGWEAAAQLAQQGYARVIVTGRTQAKAEAARETLHARVPHGTFEPLALDLDRLTTVEEAARELQRRGGAIDTVILNAGIAPPRNLTINEDGFESVLASSLIGHHVLTMRIIGSGLLADGARIVIAGSEAARGDVPTFHPTDVEDLARTDLDGDVAAAVRAYVTMSPPADYKGPAVYATTKQFVAWWAAELSDRLPAGTTVNAVSPGSTPDTNALRDVPAYMRYLMVPLFKILPGKSHSVAAGARRYLDAAAYGDEVTGEFFASPAKKMTGALTRMEYEAMDRPASRRAVWEVLEEATGVGYPSAADAGAAQ